MARRKVDHAVAITSTGKGPWYDWLCSDDGQTSADHTTLTLRTGEYLENRLWHAFTAGMKVGFEQAKAEVERG